MPTEDEKERPRRFERKGKYMVAGKSVRNRESGTTPKSTSERKHCWFNQISENSMAWSYSPHGRLLSAKKNSESKGIQH